MVNQMAVPCCLMRGGTSKGPFFNKDDLPKNNVARDQMLLAIMGSPDARQIDGLGGGHALTSKVGIVAQSTIEGVDLSFLFAQLQPDSDQVDTTPNCGNMLAAVVPFALETGLIKASADITTVRVLTENTGMLSDITVQTPNQVISYEGDAVIDGVPNTSSPIEIKFLETAGSVCGHLFPTGEKRDIFLLESGKAVQATCIDNGMPMVLVNAKDFDITGYESTSLLNSHNELKASLEDLRLKAALKMGLGDVSNKNIPKMCLLAEPIHGGAIHTRCFIPHVCHEAIGVLAAVTVATACMYEASIISDLVRFSYDRAVKKTLSIEHPTGEFSVVLDIDNEGGALNVVGAALLRTARLLMKGEVMVSPHILASK